MPMSQTRRLSRCQVWRGGSGCHRCAASPPLCAPARRCRCRSPYSLWKPSRSGSLPDSCDLFTNPRPFSFATAASGASSPASATARQLPFTSDDSNGSTASLSHWVSNRTKPPAEPAEKGGSPPKLPSVGDWLHSSERLAEEEASAQKAQQRAKGPAALPPASLPAGRIR